MLPIAKKLPFSTLQPHTSCLSFMHIPENPTGFLPTCESKVFTPTASLYSHPSGLLYGE